MPSTSHMCLNLVMTGLKGPFWWPAADEARWLLPSGRKLANLGPIRLFPGTPIPWGSAIDLPLPRIAHPLSPCARRRAGARSPSRRRRHTVPLRAPASAFQRVDGRQVTHCPPARAGERLLDKLKIILYTLSPCARRRALPTPYGGLHSQIRKTIRNIRVFSE